MKKGVRHIAKLIAGLFCALVFNGISACNALSKDTQEIQVYAPDGAPALSIASLLQEDDADDGVTYTVVDAATINTYVTGQNPKADVCILPLNMATKLLGAGEIYSLCGVVTHGNLYMLSAQETVYTQENLSLLIGKTVGVVQLANVSGLTFKIILNNANLPWTELKNDDTPSQNSINLKAISPNEITPTMSGIDVFVAPEPAASVKVEKTALNFVGNLQSLYSEGEGYPQAVLVVKNSLIQSQQSWVQSFLQEVESSAEQLATYTQTSQIEIVCKAIQSHLLEGLSPTLTVNNLTASAIQNSGVRYKSALSYKAQITTFLQEMISAQSTSALLPSDTFYYGN